MSSPAPLAGVTARAARAGLVALAVALPFEVPVLRAGPLVLTTVEVGLYATLAAWGLVELASALRGELRASLRALWSDRLALASGTLALVVCASAMAADTFRREALKFALRSLSGTLLFFAARRLARDDGTSRRVAIALVTGASLSAAAAVLEWLVPATSGVWAPFREHAFDASGLPRASGPFAYPTIGAMHWEAAVPLAIVCLGLGERPVRGPFRRGLVATTALLAGAILASATRSALAGAAVAALALLALSRGRDARMARASATALAVLVATAIAAVAAPGDGSLLGQRLRFWRDDTWFGVRYDLPASVAEVDAGATFTTPLTLHNAGTMAWQTGGPRPTRVAYHWYRSGSAPARERLVTFDGVRTDLPRDVAPGDSVHVDAVARAPSGEGDYVLAWDLVSEGVAWFSERGQPTPELRVTVVTSRGVTTGAPVQILDRPPPDPPPAPRPLLLRAAVRLFASRPLLGVGPDSFRRRYADLLPLAPSGQRYGDTRVHANSLYFETLADLGLAGVAALAWLVASAGRAAAGRWRSRDALGVGLGVSASTFFVHGVSDYFLEFTPSFALFWLLLGLLAARSMPPGDASAP